MKPSLRFFTWVPSYAMLHHDGEHYIVQLHDWIPKRMLMIHWCVFVKVSVGMHYYIIFTRSAATLLIWMKIKKWTAGLVPQPTVLSSQAGGEYYLSYLSIFLIHIFLIWYRYYDFFFNFSFLVRHLKREKECVSPNSVPCSSPPFPSY